MLNRLSDHLANLLDANKYNLQSCCRVNFAKTSFDIRNYTNEKKLSFEKDETNENRICVTFKNPIDKDARSLNQRLSNYFNHRLDQTEIEEKLELIICDLLIFGYVKEIYSYRSKECLVDYKFDKMNYSYKIYRQVEWWVIPFMILLIGVPFVHIRTKLVENKKIGRFKREFY